MARFEDKALFGAESCSGTCGEIKCGWCGTVYNKEVTGDSARGGDDVSFAYFAGKQVVECCFEKIENAVLNRMTDILPWYTRFLAAKREDLEKKEELLARAKSASPPQLPNPILQARAPYVVEPEQGGHRFPPPGGTLENINPCAYGCGAVQRGWCVSAPEPNPRDINPNGVCPNNPINK